MKKGVIWIALSFLIVASMVLASCGSINDDKYANHDNDIRLS